MKRNGMKFKWLKKSNDNKYVNVHSDYLYYAMLCYTWMEQSNEMQQVRL